MFGRLSCGRVTAVSCNCGAAGVPDSRRPAFRPATSASRDCPKTRPQDARWEDRRDACLKAIRMYRPDVICMQEVIYDSYNYFKEKFSDYVAYGFAGPEMDPYTEGYHFIGKNVIFFSKKRYEFVSSGCYWLSETPLAAGQLFVEHDARPPLQLGAPARPEERRGVPRAGHPPRPQVGRCAARADEDDRRGVRAVCRRLPAGHLRRFQFGNRKCARRVPARRRVAGGVRGRTRSRRSGLHLSWVQRPGLPKKERAPHRLYLRAAATCGPSRRRFSATRSMVCTPATTTS